MSLLGSIFGSSQSADSSQQDELFQKSSVLPDRPQHKARIVVRKGADNNNIDIDHTKTDDDKSTLNSKKNRKKRKSNSKDESIESGDNADVVNSASSNNDNDDTNDQVDERTIFVGGLPLGATTTRKSLAGLFRDCGPIESTRLRNIPVTGIKLPQSQAGNQNLVKKVCVNTKLVDHDSAKSTVQGYVVFRDVSSVDKALLKNNTTVDLGGTQVRLRVDKSTPTQDPSRSVFCGGLPYGADEVSLQDHFVRGCDLTVDDVVNVRIVRDKETHRCKGFGYVLFKDKSMVATALKLHDSTYMNKPLRVLVCGKRFKGKKGVIDDTKSSSSRRSKSGNSEKVSVGAFRRIIAKQQQDAAEINKRKRGSKKKSVTKAGGGTSGLSRRAALDKKVDKKVKKLQKRITKGMGKTRKASK